jgi:hypothetical protein
VQLISCGFVNFEGWQGLFPPPPPPRFFGFSVCIFWHFGDVQWSFWVSVVLVVWVFGHGVVICRFVFQPMFNVAFHWSSLGFWVFSAVQWST